MLPGKSFAMKAAAILRKPVPEIPRNIPYRPFFNYSLSSPRAKWMDRLQNCALSAIGHTLYPLSLHSVIPMPWKA